MAAAIRLLVGLGNPGAEYAATRHNAGAWFAEAVARRHGAGLQHESKFFGHTGRLVIDGCELRLLVPATYMNRSGQAVAAMARFYKLAPDAILVAHDELDLPPGVARLKQGGGHGGHNGLRDIIASLGNDNGFGRLRIGIGHPGNAALVTNYVLGKPPAADRSLVEQAMDAAAEQLPALVAGDWSKAMNRLHGFTAQ